MMEYSVIIRTLGKAGDLYRMTLDSVRNQTIRPSFVLVYIAEGYPIPKEAIGIEEYHYVPKGMVAQRALQYDEVKTEYCLFLDDDVYLPQDAVEKMYNELIQHNAQVISPCTFNNHEMPTKAKLIKAITGKEVCRIRDDRWAFKVLRTSGFSYNNNPTRSVYESQSNAGPCFFCRKDDFLRVRFHDERWLDKAPYALPEDQVMYYKMHKMGMKVLTSFDTGIVHLDAGTTMTENKDRNLKLIFSEYRNKFIFWHRYIYLPEKTIILNLWDIIVLIYVYGLQTLKYSIGYICGKREEAKAYYGGVKDAMSFVRSAEYKALPRI